MQKHRQAGTKKPHFQRDDCIGFCLNISVALGTGPGARIPQWSASWLARVEVEK
jgi:hypothetical protein